jgi:hypothetical protein
MEDKRYFPWSLLLIEYATQEGYMEASPERKEEIINNFVSFMGAKVSENNP